MAFKRKGAISSYSTINSTSGSTTLGSAKDSITIAPEEGATTITKLVADDLEKPSVKYHWITKSAAPRQIKGTVTIDGKEYSKAVSFNVEAPDAEFTSETGIIDIVDFPSINKSKLSYGYVAAPGIVFNGNINGQGGKQIWQRVDLFEQRKLDSNGNLVEKESWINRSDSYPSADGTSYDDSPTGSPLDKNIFTKLSISDIFTTWLMYKHPDEGIWVPLREIHWWWSGVAEYNDTLQKWEKIRPDNNENPASVESKKLPEWNGSAN